VPSNQLTARPLAATDELHLALAAIPSRFGLTREFPAAALDEAQVVAERAGLPDLDRTDVPFVTIDPAGSTDLDQALFLSRDGDGYRVLYAIADVPAFVHPRSALDSVARERGQTIYAPDGRIPLHPPIISENAASLLADQLRGAFIWDMQLDATGDVTEARVYRARVRSRRQLDYETAQAEIDAGTADESLALLKEIGLKRIQLEIERGGASLGTQETEVELRDGHYVIERRIPHPVEDWNAQISLMTGMSGAAMMLAGGIGLLRAMPPADSTAVDRFRRQTIALGNEWQADQRYGDYLRSLDVTQPRHLAIMHAATSLFRGAGYTPFDGELPEHTDQAAVAAPYAHVTAPLRRLVDRFALVACEALSAGEPVPQWVRDALPELPKIMASTSSIAGQVYAAAINVVEAAVLQPHVGEVFSVTVVSSGSDYGIVQIDEPAITARCDGILEPGTVISATLVTAEVSTGTVRFALA
jgi:exoribonuclease R